jgi:hypothetical protein
LGAHPESCGDGYNNIVHFMTSNSKVRKSSEKMRLATEVELESEGMWD